MKRLVLGTVFAILVSSVGGWTQGAKPVVKPGAANVPSATIQKAKPAAEPATRVTAEILSGLALRNIGPAIMSGRISDIVIHPTRRSVWYVAAGSGGVWKTENAGTTWTPVFDAQPSYSIGCITLDPSNPDIVWVGTGENVSGRHVGYGDGVYKSEDAGKTWRKLTVGLPTGDVGKIGLAVSPINPRVVYATMEASPDERGFYRSADKGESFEKRNSMISGGTGPHYYQEIFADPNVFDRVYQMAPAMVVTNDGGKTFRPVGEKSKHVDNHAMAFQPGEPGYILNGNDGGVYESRDGGKNWRFFENLPLTQFYKVALDNARPFYNVHGGTQDNGSQLGPSRTLNANGISNADWTMTYGADGYASAIDPTDPNTIYIKWQEGNLLRYDRQSHETIDISPKPGPGDPLLRFNWDSPILVSPHAHTRLFYGSQYVWKSNDRGDSWTRISPDLTRNIFRLTQPIMGKTWSADALWDHGAMSMFSTISTISESPLVEGLIYAGTDDGLIQVTEDGGSNWRTIEKLPGVPDNFFVNKIRASMVDKDVVFAAVDAHKTGDLKAYLLRSDDRGRTWTSIAGDLPARTIVWSIAQDHIKKDLLFAGTEFGMFVTLDGGTRWVKLGGGAPTISFRDIEIHRREHDLVGASFGRGFFILDDYSPLRQIDETTLLQNAMVFPVKAALSYIPLRPIDSSGKASRGETFYLAPNPPFGAVFSYYLKDTLKPAAEARRADEQKLTKDGKPVTFPGWDVLRKEDQEDKPLIVLTVSDHTGQVVRRISGPSSAGVHRVAWDLRYPAVDPTSSDEASSGDEGESSPQGPLVVPGTFSVSLAKMVDGTLAPPGAPQSFVVESLGLALFPEKDKAALLEYQKKAGELQRAMMGASAAADEALKTIRLMKKALRDTPKADPTLGETARTIEVKIRAALRDLVGDQTVGRRSEARTSPLMDRVSNQTRSTGPITQTVRRDYEIAADGFGVVLETLRGLIERDLRTLGAALEAAGAPWTPGRGVPVWKK